MFDAQEQFWLWFVAHQDELFDFETDQERILDEHSKQLNWVNPHLSFEFGPARVNSRRPDSTQLMGTPGADEFLKMPVLQISTSAPLPQS